jgi:hypothetical protein
VTGPAFEPDESSAPFEVPNPGCRRSDGTLSDTFEAADALRMDVEVSCFNHDRP